MGCIQVTWFFLLMHVEGLGDQYWNVTLIGRPDLGDLLYICIMCSHPSEFLYMLGLATSRAVVADRR